MENLLNLCWVLLAAAALLAWRCQAMHAHAGRRLQLVALLCVLALMFPVISATDDLHPAAQAIEDPSKRIQKAWTAINSVGTRVKYGLFPAVLVLTSIAVPHAGAVEWLRPTAVPSLQDGRTLLRPERAPPVLTF